MITQLKATCNTCGRILYSTRCHHCGESAIDTIREGYALEGFSVEGLEVSPIEPPKDKLEVLADVILGRPA